MELKLNNKGMSLIEIIISITLISMVLIFIFSLLVNVKDINNQSELNSTYLIKKALMISDIEDDLMNSEKIFIGKCYVEDPTATLDEYKYKHGTYAFHATYKNEFSSFTGDENLFKKAGMCIQFEIDRPDPIPDATAWLAIHYCTESIKLEDKGYKISYVADDGARFTRELPDFEIYNVTGAKLKHKPSIKFGKSTSSTIYTNEFVENTPSTFKEYSIDTSSSATGLISTIDRRIELSKESTGKDYAVIKIPIIGADGKDYTYLISYHAN